MSGVEYCDGDIRWLTPDDLVDINNFAITVITPKERRGVMSRDLLEGAHARPVQHRAFNGTNDMPTLAAVLFEAVSQAHAFHNANKRTAFLATVMFMRMNGYFFSPPMDEAVEIARGSVLHEYSTGQVAHWIAQHTTQSDSAELVSDFLHVVFDYYEDL